VERSKTSEKKQKFLSFCDINDDTGQDTLRNLQDRFDVNRIMFQKCNVTNQEEMAGKSGLK
jgi:hypothetical protein